MEGRPSLESDRLVISHELEEAMKRVLVVTTILVVAMLGLMALPASAHTHSLTLPGGKTQPIAGGNVEGADWHPLHCVVHLGTAGTFGFDRPSNPVDIVKVGDFTGSCAAKPGS